MSSQQEFIVQKARVLINQDNAEEIHRVVQKHFGKFNFEEILYRVQTLENKIN